MPCEELLLLFNLAKHIWLPHPGLCGVTLPVLEEFEAKKVARDFRGRKILLCRERLKSTGAGAVV